ncbi:MAG: hypothetical protein KAU17_09410 [Spirochaetales bacterium]|nr:hypothetical protein [Spirochaetales bacterium]
MGFQDDHDLEEEKKILDIVDTFRYSNAVRRKIIGSYCHTVVVDNTNGLRCLNFEMKFKWS